MASLLHHLHLSIDFVMHKIKTEQLRAVTINQNYRGAIYRFVTSDYAFFLGSAKGISAYLKQFLLRCSCYSETVRNIRIGFSIIFCRPNELRTSIFPK